MATIKDLIEENLHKCIFCQSQNSQELSPSIDGKEYTCSNCGSYQISATFLGCTYSDDVLLDFLKKAPAIAAERKLHGQDGFKLTTATWQDFLKDYPQDFIEKMDRALVKLAFESNWTPTQILLGHNDFGKLFIEYCISNNYEGPDFELMLKPLAAEGMITYNSTADMIYTVQLTVAGLKRAVELRNKHSNKHSAFIAMWFNNATDLFKEKTKEAIVAAGYKPEIVIEEHHNDFIMDKVINLINDSRFVIADLTSIPEQTKEKSSGVRGGVYYEAGYAKGLGRPVIFTCSNDSHSRVHFDLQQMNTILWHQNDNGVLMTGNFNYVEYLTERIIATVGKGPLLK